MTFEKEYFSHQRTEMLDYFPQSAKFALEVGCGEGLFGKHLKERFNCEVWGIEQDRSSADKAKNNLDKIFNSSFTDIINTLPVNYFDVIIFNDVLEHFDYPDKILVSIRKLLKKDTGYVMASIPNVRYIGNLRELLIHKDWKYKHEGGILDYTHLRFFTKKSIERMFSECGYYLELIKGINPAKGCKFLLFNLFTAGFFYDSKYPQFACRAKLTKVV